MIMSERIKVLIDTDAGIDDAHAILILLQKRYNVDVVGITTCHGNASVDQVCLNVLRLLKEANRIDIPVFRGSEVSLIDDRDTRDPSVYHGHDGFGDVPDPDAPDASLIQKENAIQAMLRIANDHQGEITLICLGPLTNLAVALKVDSDLGSKLKECIIMGGNYEGKGNVTLSAEFNFHSDPEAAHIVLNRLSCRILLVTWELSVNSSLEWEWRDRIVNHGSNLSRFLKLISEKTIQTFYSNKSTFKYITCDEIAAAIAVNRAVVRTGSDIRCNVELHGSLTRGQVVVDWRERSGKPPNVFIVTELDMDLYKSILYSSVSGD